ncbi:unnamed protein product [Bathycoccus prasinos]
MNTSKPREVKRTSHWRHVPTQSMSTEYFISWAQKQSNDRILKYMQKWEQNWRSLPSANVPMKQAQ